MGIEVIRRMGIFSFGTPTILRLFDDGRVLFLFNDDDGWKLAG